MENDTFIPEYTEDFDLTQLDLRDVFEFAQARKSNAYDVLKQRNYPVFKFITGGDGIDGNPVAGDRIEAFEYDEARKIFTPMSKAGVSEQSPIITLTASTTALDMVRDVMTESAIQDMKAAAKGTTVFLNHRYNLPEDLFGTVEEVETVQRTLTNPLTKETANYLCLDYKVRAAGPDENPRAWQVYQMLAKGRRRLGASVTVMLLEKAENTDGTRSIKKVFYIETSMVGIPCNPLSWAHQAQKALRPAKKIVLPATAPVERKSAMDKKETEPALPVAEDAKVETKGMYADKVQAKNKKFWFQVETLNDCIYDLKAAASRKQQMDFPGELAEALTEFSAAVTDAVLPILTGPQDNNNYSYYGLFGPDDAQRVVDHIVTKMVSDLGIEAELVRKAGARNNKKDREHIQSIHDYCVELGCKCGTDHKSAEEGAKAAPVAAVSTETESVPASPAVAVDGEIVTKVASLEGEIVSKEAKIAELEQSQQGSSKQL